MDEFVVGLLGSHLGLGSLGQLGANIFGDLSISYHGWLNKYGGKYIGSWRRRYCVLHRNGLFQLTDFFCSIVYCFFWGSRAGRDIFDEKKNDSKNN